MNVSRETNEKLVRFADLVEKWNPIINLVSKASLPALWKRHIEDSAQLYDLAPNFETWVDLGSGGGFPALIVAILASDEDRRKVIMVESDHRKCEFLRHVSRELSLRTEVITARIEEIAPIEADVLSARALAPLDMLLEHCARHRKPDGIAFFPKGRSYKKELQDIEGLWNMDYTAHVSKTDADAVVLELRGISRVGS